MLRLADNRYAYPALLLVLYLCGLFLVWPEGEFPLNDDWSYTKSVRSFLHEGRLQIGDWAAMTLCTNILWGAAFCKVFGFSFFVLRLSSMVSAFVGILLTYGLLKKLGASRTGAFISTATLLFNPYFFNLSTTFMTDVNFLVLLLAGIYTALLFRETGRAVWAVLFIVVCVLCTLLRQYGIMLPFCLLLSAFFSEKARWKLFLTGAVAFVSGIIALWLYEKHISGNLNPWAEYKFVLLENTRKQDFIMNLVRFLPERLPQIISQVLVYVFPCSLFLLYTLWRQTSLRKKITVAAVALIVTVPVVIIVQLFPGNVVGNMHVGPETFFQNYSGHSSAPKYSNWSATFEALTEVLGFVLVYFSFFGVALAMPTKFRLQKMPAVNFGKVLVIFLLLCYIVLIGVTSSYIDRYHLPLIALALLLLPLQIHSLKTVSPSLVVLIFLAYMSVAGTRDYFEINRARWGAYYYAVNELKADHRTVHAGFEAKCWDQGAMSWWQDQELPGNDYLVQTDPEPGFEKVKRYPFSRSFPFRRDTVYLFTRIK